MFSDYELEVGPQPSIQTANSHGKFSGTCNMNLPVLHYTEPFFSLPGSFRVHRVGVDICLDPNETYALLILNCPVEGYNYITERAPVVRTWSKVSDDCEENTVLYCAPDSSNPAMPADIRPEFLAEYPELIGVVGFGLDPGVDQEVNIGIREHSLLFIPSLSDIDLARRSLGTWNCTISNRNGSASALTTVSICGVFRSSTLLHSLYIVPVELYTSIFSLYI